MHCCYVDWYILLSTTMLTSWRLYSISKGVIILGRSCRPSGFSPVHLYMSPMSEVASTIAYDLDITAIHAVSLTNRAVVVLVYY